MLYLFRCNSSSFHSPKPSPCFLCLSFSSFPHVKHILRFPADMKGWLLEMLLQFCSYTQDMYTPYPPLILSLNHESSVPASVNIHFLESFIPLDCGSLDTSLSFTHHNHPSLLPLPPFIYILFSLSLFLSLSHSLRPRFNSIVEKTTSVSLTSSWLFMGERKSPFYYFTRFNKQNLNPPVMQCQCATVFSVCDS